MEGDSKQDAVEEMPLCAPCVTVQVSENGDKTAEGEPEPFVPPIERIISPADVIDIQPDDESVYIIGTRDTKVTTMRGLDKAIDLKEVTLRSCLLTRIEGLENLKGLKSLELYDNVIESFSQLEFVCETLTVLDVSFNSIKDMSPVRVCRRLRELYIAQNKLKEIAGLEEMTELKILDLGANRIKCMSGLEGLVSLESAWLGKNKIDAISHIGHLPRLRQLDIQNNRLTSLGDDLKQCSSLEELYLSSNAITSTSGLPESAPLRVLDLSSNKVKDISSIERCLQIEELWMSGSALENVDELRPIHALKSISCLYLEHSPIAKMANYRQEMKSLFPTLEQLDADLYR